jgi:hypothetical protein
MLLDPITAIFCTGFTVMTPGTPPAACQTVINASSVATQATVTLNQLQTYGEQTAYKLVDKEIIYGTAGVIYIINSWNTKTFMLQFPLKPFEFNFNLANNAINGGLKIKYEF